MIPNDSGFLSPAPLIAIRRPGVHADFDASWWKLFILGNSTGHSDRKLRRSLMIIQPKKSRADAN
jgi:hypothetical protein